MSSDQRSAHRSHCTWSASQCIHLNLVGKYMVGRIFCSHRWAGEDCAKKGSNGRKARGKGHVWPCIPTDMNSYGKVWHS